MIRSLTVLLLIWTFATTALAEERNLVSRWLIAGPMEVALPVFHDTENTRGSTYSYKDMLAFGHADIEELFPEEGTTFRWMDGRSFTWQEAVCNEEGMWQLSPAATTEKPHIAYLATYIKADRWLEAELEIKSPYMFEAWLNGSKAGTKSSTEEEDESPGRFVHKMKLPLGKHLLVIKALRPAGAGPAWNIQASLSVKEPYLAAELSASLSPVNNKHILHIMDGVKITGIDPSSDGSYYMISYSKSLPPADQSERWTDIRRTSDNKLIHSFRHSRASRFGWLPLSQAVSYIVTQGSQSSIYRHDMETGEARLIARGIERLGGFSWSPNEQFIIYAIREEGKGEDASMRQVLGMQDRQSNWRSRHFLYKLDVSSGVHMRLTHGNLSHSLHDISPDSRYMLFSQTRPDYLERPYSKTDLMLLDLHTLGLDTLLEGQRWSIRAGFSPDGRKLLATGGPSSFGGAGQNLPEGMIPNNYDTQAYIYDLESKEVECITLAFHPSVSSTYWSPADGHIYLLATDTDFQRVFRYDTKNKRFSPVDTGVDNTSSISFASRARVMAYLGNQTNAPGKAWLKNLQSGRISVLDDTESKTYRHVRFGQVHDWHFEASTGVEVKGRYYLPPDFDPDKQYPVIVYYYGGTTPVGRGFGGRYPFNLWAGNGYVVYVLQPSGAIGFGQEFSAAHVNNWGITVADEIIEGTRRFLEAHPFTDPAKVGCAGASYGGFMTMLLQTRTDIFAAAISHAGISNISSYWGEGYWGYAYSAEATAESFPWNNPDIYIGQSPLFHADKITTPLLLLTGDSDTNVPPGESIQLYTALKILGRPVELIMVKGEDHHIVTYNRRIEWHHAIMAWWDRYLKEQPEWWLDQFPENNY